MYACLLLAMHPDIQEKLYHDVVSICGLDDPITLEKLPKIDYAERIIKETLRLFPSAPIIGRYTQGDLDIGGRVIPKHSTVYLHIVYTHRDPRFWQEPLTFDPDRFLQENASKIYPFSYIPFSYGSRNCIGLRFAMTSIKIALVNLIRKVKVFTDYKSVEDVKLKAHFLLRPRDGWKLRFEARN
ncbi:unnamed protein product [Acanthoscelides obtectus]|nr:unnamed protein product [Acanthoscelides obtectus]CAK1677569.1 Probable cytochrome P450 4ac1 [Acanthoscelides obtectus]